MRIRGRSMTIFRCETLAAKFAALRIERERLYKLGKVSQANAKFDQSRKVAAELMALRQDRHAALFALLDHDSEEVVLGAASYLLAVDESMAMKVLQRLDSNAKEPEHGLSAHMCIQEWMAGRMMDIRDLK